MDKAFRGFMDVIHEINRGQQVLHGGGAPRGADNQERTHVTAWAPTTDVFVKDGDLVIRAELAGVKQEDLEVTFNGGTLTISVVSGAGAAKQEPKQIQVGGISKGSSKVSTTGGAR
jgi:HSP20 family molecular chaperone IbpA